jgi:CDP-diacylglycerol---glycerol-3-phosphate 3-phosphatidyltransferase
MIESEILLSLWPVIFLLLLFFITILIFSFLYERRPKDTSIPTFVHKTFVGSFLREYGYWVTKPVSYIFIKLKLKPNSITLTAPVFAVLSGYFYYKGDFGYAGGIMLLGGVLDFLDGRLARATNQITKEGAFLDSNLDRYSDGIIFCGIALYFRDNLLMLFIVILSIIGIQITSYAKARAELNGVISRLGLMQRTERYVLLGAVSVFHPFIMILLNRNGIISEYPIIIVLVLMAVLTNYTAIARITYSFYQIRKQSGK